MGTARRFAAIVSTLGLAAVGLVGTSGPAGAGPVLGPSSPNTPGAHSFTVTVATASSTQSTGLMSWNNTTWALSLRATTGRLASGSCVTVYFDWRATGHHDARGLRDCRSNDTYTY